MNHTTTTVQLVTITPEMAQSMLAKNTGNRNPSRRLIEQLKLSMERDEWEINGEAIKIADDGTVLDGQHRLYACIESGKPFTTYVITGLSRKTQDTMDTGKSRTLSDVLKIRGEKATFELAAVLAGIVRVEKWDLAAAFRGGGSSSGYPITIRECLERLDAEPTLRAITELSIRYRRTGLTAKMSGILYYVFSQIDADDAEYFFEKLLSGADLPEGSPILTLKKWLQINRMESGAGGLRNQYYTAAVAVKAWNKFRDGASLKKLSFRPGGANPESFPEPK